MLYPDSWYDPNVESLLVHARRNECLKKEALHFKSVSLNARQLCDLEMLLNRAYYPLDGYMCRTDYDSVLKTCRLSDGSLWPLPICLGVDAETASGVSLGERVAIRDAEGFMLAVLTVEDVWKADLEAERIALWGDRPRTGGIDVSGIEGDRLWYLGGKLEGLSYPQHYDFVDMRLSPPDMQRLFSREKWGKVIGVQAGRPLHRADRAMLEEIASAHDARLLLSPLMIPSVYFSVDHFCLVRCLRAFAGLMPEHAVKLNLIPWFQRRMGRRGSLLRAIVNRNYGCSHMLLWDSGKMQSQNLQHSESFHAHMEWMAEMARLSGITPLREKCMTLDEASGKHTCSAKGCLCVNDHLAIVECLRAGEAVPDNLSYPEVLKELGRVHKPLSKQGFALFFTGLSGAGKSTLAKILYVKLLELNGRPVTLLDGDIVRTNLSSELNFSKEHRELNVTRIGFVASEIVKNGGVAICAPIAPYPKSREEVRKMIEQYGGFIEIHVNTPLSVCEQRDCKGIYAKARAGIIKGMTGVDDPYAEPENPELRINTSEMTPDEAAREVMFFLATKNYIRGNA